MSKKTGKLINQKSLSDMFAEVNSLLKDYLLPGTYH